MTAGYVFRDRHAIDDIVDRLAPLRALLGDAEQADFEVVGTDAEIGVAEHTSKIREEIDRAAVQPLVDVIRDDRSE